MSVEIYKVGLLCCSVCAPVEMTPEEVEREVNDKSPSGTTNGWTISTDKAFADGTPIPAPCNMGGGRQHWLLDC